jgi:hypothetical protein
MIGEDKSRFGSCLAEIWTFEFLRNLDGFFGNFASCAPYALAISN